MAANLEVALIAVVHALVSTLDPQLLLSPAVKISGTHLRLNGTGEEIDASSAAKEFAKLEKAPLKGMLQDSEKLFGWLSKLSKDRLHEIRRLRG